MQKAVANKFERAFPGRGDGGPATSAELESPTGVAVDSGGKLYIADEANNVIRKVNASNGIIATVAGLGLQSGLGGGEGYSGDGGPAQCRDYSKRVDRGYRR